MMYDLVAATYEGFLQPLVWNFILSQMSLGKLVGCNGIGMWGLLFFDDDGAMMEKCLKTGIVGAKAVYYDTE